MNHSPDAMVAANLMPFFIILCELFNGILQPPHQMPVFWQYTMYYITPFTYWIGGTMAMVLDGRPVVCDVDELVYLELPSNTTCGAFAEPFLQSASGYISNPDESRVGEMCGYCQYASGEDVSLTRSIFSELETDIGLFGSSFKNTDCLARQSGAILAFSWVSLSLIMFLCLSLFIGGRPRVGSELLVRRHRSRCQDEIHLGRFWFTPGTRLTGSAL